MAVGLNNLKVEGSSHSIYTSICNGFKNVWVFE